jgi:hypothetical protein
VRDRIRAAWLSLPDSVRRFVIDSVEGAAAAVIVLNLAIPGSLSEAQAQGLLIVSAIASPILAAARRYLLPAFLGLLAYLFPRPE